MHKKISAIAMFLIVFATVGRAQQNPLMGTWKGNAAKGKSMLGAPPLTVDAKYEPSGSNGVKYTSDRVNSNGTKSHVEFTANFNGKTYPYKTTGNDAATRDGISILKIDNYNYRISYKLKGETTQINYWVISKDGKTLTTVSAGVATDATGKPVADPIYVRLAVADKQ